MILRVQSSAPVVARVVGLSIAVGLLWLPALPAYAAESGPTLSGDMCMQRVFAGAGKSVTNANTLNCSASDVRLSEAIKVTPESCIEGEPFTLTATFRTVVTADSRYDVGFYFRTDGKGTARGETYTADEVCSLSALYPTGAPGKNLDADACGDLNAGTYEEVTFTIPNVACVPAPGSDRVRLPNCTSWHSNKSNVCAPIEDPYGFDPDTKSKCTCDDNFTVPVVVQRATLSVEKLPSPGSVVEPGGDVTFTVIISNDAEDESASVVLETLLDDMYGDLFDLGNPDVTGNSCPDLFGEVLLPGDSRVCEFTSYVAGEYGASATDSTQGTVEACAKQALVEALICGEASAAVAITDASVSPTLKVTATAAANCQVDATYEVVVANHSTVDAMTVSSLVDDTFGDITKIQGGVVATNCPPTPVTIEKGGALTCSFVGRLKRSTCAFTHTNQLTGQVTDDDGVTSAPWDTATVSVSAAP